MVHRFLVTGTDEDLTAFHFPVCFFANAIDRKEQTIFYTVMGEDYERFIEVGKATGVTIQKRDEKLNQTAERWAVVLKGKASPWKMKKAAGT